MRCSAAMRRSYDFDFFKVKWLGRYGWIVDRPPAAVVVPESADGRLWLVHIARVPTGTPSWELPGGEVHRGETAVRAGLRELEEETGLVARGGAELWPRVLEAAPGMGRMPHHVIIARGVQPAGARPRPQRDEGIRQVRCFTREEIVRRVADGRIHVLATLGALAVTGWSGRPIQ